jgi:uncharacterized membrane protein YbhN (UPF0104 family)
MRPVSRTSDPIAVSTSPAFYPHGISAAIFRGALKWSLLLRVQGMRPGFGAALEACWTGSFVSNYLPSNVSGDVVRLIVLRTEGRRPEIASSILVERLTGLVVLVALAAGALALRPGHFDDFGLLPLCSGSWSSAWP